MNGARLYRSGKIGPSTTPRPADKNMTSVAEGTSCRPIDPYYGDLDPPSVNAIDLLISQLFRLFSDMVECLFGYFAFLFNTFPCGRGDSPIMNQASMANV